MKKLMRWVLSCPEVLAVNVLCSGRRVESRVIATLPRPETVPVDLKSMTLKAKPLEICWPTWAVIEPLVGANRPLVVPNGMKVCPILASLTQIVPGGGTEMAALDDRVKTNPAPITTSVIAVIPNSFRDVLLMLWSSFSEC